MRFSTKNIKPEVTKEQILEKVSELEVFNLFLDEPLDIKETISSPLREDPKPSFVLLKSYRKIIYFDFASGDTGDCFAFVMALYDCNYIDALNKINDAIGNPYNTAKFKFLNLNDVARDKVKDIEVRPKLFDDHDKEFWSSFSITSKTLKERKITSISRYKISKYVFLAENYAYAYRVGTRIKVYQPYSKKFKFFGNTNQNSIQGYEYMDFKQRELFIVSSMKEVLVMAELGFTAIAPNSESSLFKREIMDYLHTKFVRIYVLFDWDAAGHKLTNRFITYYNNIEPILVPLETEEKDLSDFTKKFDLEKTYKLIKKWKN